MEAILKQEWNKFREQESVSIYPEEIPSPYKEIAIRAMNKVKICNKPAVSVALPLNGDKDKIIKFFKAEYELGFCTKEYYERVKWYFDTYEHEFFSNPCAVGGNER